MNIFRVGSASINTSSQGQAPRDQTIDTFIAPTRPPHDIQMYINVHSYMRYCTPMLSYASSWRSDGVSPTPTDAATAITATMRLVAVLSEPLPSLTAALTPGRASELLLRCGPPPVS